MAIRVPIVSDFEDRGIKSATAAFSRFKADIAKADGAMNKFRAGTSSAFSAVQANALSFAAVAGTAIATFAAKAVISYQQLGLAVGKFADATGVTTEEASRLIEVTSDLNIESSSLQTALNKLNRAAAAGAEGFKTIGAEIARTSTGAVDIQQTFLNVVDGLNRIPDPAQRAKVATELLGKGWQDLAVIIGGGAEKLRKSLESVSDAKIYSPEQVAQARRLQDAIANLKDVGEDFAQSVGRALTPAVIAAVEAITSMLNTLKSVRDFEIFGVKVGDVAGFLAKFGASSALAAYNLTQLIGASEESAVVTDEMKTAWLGGYDAMVNAEYASKGLSRGIEDVNGVLAEQAQQLAFTEAAWDSFTKGLDLEQTLGEAKTYVTEFQTRWAEAMADGTFNLDVFNQELLAAKIYIAGVGEEIMLTKTIAEQSEFKIAVDTGDLERALELLYSIRAAQLSFSIEAGKTYAAIGTFGGVEVGNINQLDLSGLNFMADGGVVEGPTLAVIGEAGPEAVIPLDRLGGMGGITVNVSGSVVTENDLIESIRRGLANSQRNGSQLVYSNL
jgi:hypothetical protein